MTSIVIEGPNGSGKSTLTKKLQNDIGLIAFHATRPKDKKQAIKFAIEQVSDISEGKSFIYDRSHAISRQVYQADALDEEERRLYNAHIEYISLTTPIIYCVGSGKRDTNKPHYDKQLIEETTKNQDKIKANYEELMQNIPHIRYDFKKDSYNNLLLKLTAL